MTYAHPVIPSVHFCFVWICDIIIKAIESEVAWVVPGTYTTTNYACYEDGSNCVIKEEYVDPSNNVAQVKRRLERDNRNRRRRARRRATSDATAGSNNIRG
jgi:hypothetical protein